MGLHAALVWRQTRFLNQDASLEAFFLRSILHEQVSGLWVFLLEI